MKSRLSFLGVMLLFLTGAVFAANGSAYYNLISLNVGPSSELYLSQGEYPCTDASWTLTLNGTVYSARAMAIYSNSGRWNFFPVGSCISAVKDTPKNLYDLINEKWASSSTEIILNLASDLDLAGFDSDTPEGKCEAQHLPLPAQEKSSFNGNHFTIKNLCYVGANSDQPVGFFSKINYGVFQNVKMDGVKIIIKDSSLDGASYNPAGAFAGVVGWATVDSISVANVFVDGPFAGGIAGLIDNSSFYNITADDDIFVQNSTKITGSAAGSALVNSSSPYKVFLGGIAGMAIRVNDDKTFDQGMFKVEVKDVTGTNISALGGVAGVLSATTETISNVKVYTKKKSGGEIVPSRISGGSAMGGLFGYVTYVGDGVVKEYGDVSISNSYFEGEITGAIASDIMAVGGLIGRDSTNGGVSLKITNSQSVLTLSDEVKNETLASYFAGGILGYSNNCVNGTADTEDYVSITHSNTSGSIKILKDAQTSDGHLQVFAGGIAGAVCLALDGNGLAYDSTSMDIDVDVHSAMDESRVSQGKPVYDSVIVGGFVGATNVAMARPLVLYSLLGTGKIHVSDSLNTIHLGGVVGDFRETNGAKGISFKNVILENDQFITYQAVNANRNGNSAQQMASIGGLCGFCRNIDSVQFVGISGPITVSGEYSGDSLLVGGLFGNIYKSGTDAAMVIRNTYTDGNILVTATENGKKRVGYLVGSGIVYQGFHFLANYHYAEGESIRPFGALNTGTDLAEWTTHDDIHYVLRNGDAVQISDHHNGVELDSVMHETAFAAFLNTGAGEYVWAFEQGYKNSLPFFADDEHAAAGDGYRVRFIGYDPNNKTFTQLKIQLVAVDSAAVPPVLGEWEGHPFIGWDKDFSKVRSDMRVTALYDTLKFTVSFYGADSSAEPILKYENVLYDSAVVAPDLEEYAENLQKEGWSFAGWSDDSYKAVVKDLEIYPVYDTLYYTLTLISEGVKIQQWEHSLMWGDSLPEFPDVEKAENDSMVYTFAGWMPDVKTMPASDLELFAQFDSTVKKMTVTFVDHDGSVIDVRKVNYGSSVVPPEYENQEKIRFESWSDTSFSRICKDTEIYASVSLLMLFKFSETRVDTFWVSKGTDLSFLETISVERENENGYSFTFKNWSENLGIAESPMVVTAIFDSVYIGIPNSSSSSDVSSSSSPDWEIENPKLEVSGNAVRLTYGLKNFDPSVKTQAKVVVENSNGTFLEYAVSDSLVENDGVFSWTKAISATGKNLVYLEVSSKKASQIVLVDSVFIEDEIKVQAGRWKMVSLSTAKESASELTSKASVYWWSEADPIGDFWQYRSYEARDFEATRGFWYGSSAGYAIALQSSEDSVGSSIVWDLDSLYSGWNMVSNPYGWRVDLSRGESDNGEKVTFWKWNSETASYDSARVIEPYEAVWAKVSRKTTWTVKADPYFETSQIPMDAKGEPTILRKSSALAGGWTLRAVLKDGSGRMDSWNILGAGSQETLDKAPEGMGDYVRLTILDGKRKLAKSVKPVSDQYQWQLKLSATSSREGELSFEGLNSLKQQGLSLYLTVDGVTQEVDGPVKLSLAKSAKTASLRVVPAVNTVASAVSGFTVSSMDNGLQLGFVAPESLAGSLGSYALVDVKGKVVSSGKFKVSDGSNQLSLKTVKAGLHFIQLKVGSQKASAKVFVKAAP